MNKLYTKSGDDGYTSFGDGKRVKKYSDLIELYGSLDELNVFLGYAAESFCGNDQFIELSKQLYRIQKDLFELASSLASEKRFIVDPQKISILEIEIDAMTEKLPVLRSFILPSGGESASRLHLSRAICRRAERAAFKLVETNDNAETIGVYLNRLSDWLYAAARTAALILNVEEVEV